jgi:hypothetical protein
VNPLSTPSNSSARWALLPHRCAREAGLICVNAPEYRSALFSIMSFMCL